MPIHTSFFLLSLSLFLTITKPIKQIVSPEKWKLVLHVGLLNLVYCLQVFCKVCATRGIPNLLCIKKQV